MHEATGALSRHEALLRVAEYELYLFSCHARKPFQKFIDPGAALQILK